MDNKDVLIFLLAPSNSLEALLLSVTCVFTFSSVEVVAPRIELYRLVLAIEDELKACLINLFLFFPSSFYYPTPALPISLELSIVKQHHYHPSQNCNGKLSIVLFDTALPFQGPVC